jgi:arylsulfatase A-like enzyme
MQHGAELQTEVNGMITFLDESMGNLTAALKRTGLWANLLLVYSPDK